MEKPKFFEFTSIEVGEGKKQIRFNYQTIFKKGDPILFTEVITMPSDVDVKKIPEELFNKILKDLHLALGISYYKLHCATKFKLEYFLSKEQANFWNNYYSKGLGEFIFKNKLDPKIIPQFPHRLKNNPESFKLERNTNFLVAIGGGKDSIVSVELLKNYGADISTFFVKTQDDLGLIDNLNKVMETNLFKINRQLDPKVFDREAGYLQGHIPISGIYAFLGIFVAALSGFSYLVVSNEFSSNFGNTRYKGKTINHQWSKSSEFENLFQDYVKKFISPDLQYFSLLRPLYEIRIAELFAKQKKYFPYFSSCNNNFKAQSTNQESGKLWCGKCAKCLFSFLILSPFMEKDELINIFGSNLFSDVENLPTIRDILGFGRIKPFDCVGTFDEAKAAFYLSRKKFHDDLAGEIFLPKIDPLDNRYLFNERKVLLKIYFNGKKKPNELIEKVFKSQESNVPDFIKFLGMKNALILGYGKEGQISEKYLRKFFPDVNISVGDEKVDIDYLQKQKDNDIAVRSPGIKKEYLKIPYTTATNIFLSYLKQRPNIKIVGVTGSKGKSTTSALIMHILETANKKAKFLGNIGTPMLGELMDGSIEENTIIVLELSSYQLDDIRFSPDIAVITSLFPEHMDYHRNIKNYFSAKKNIINFQSSDDIFVLNPKNAKMVSWSKNTLARLIPFASEIHVDESDIKIPGKHNLENISAAVAVAEALGISQTNIKKAIKSFNGLPHRLEFVGEFKDIKFYDDAISTTPESTMAAVNTLEGIDTIFLGGQDRGYVFTKLERLIKKKKIRNVVLFPDSGNRIFKKGRKGLNILETESMEDAVKFAYQNTQPGKTCLLSCASPSYSIWKNFEEKGDQFKSFVKELGK